MIVLPSAQRFEARLRCACFSSSKSSAADNRIAGTDQATIGASGANVASGGGRIVSLNPFAGGNPNTNSRKSQNGGLPAGGMAYAEEGAVSAGGDIVTGGLQIDAAGNVSITGGTDALLESNQAWMQTLKELTEDSTSALTAAGGQTKSILDTVLGAVSGLAEGKQTDGESRTKQYVFWGAVALGGVYLASVALKKRS